MLPSKYAQEYIKQVEKSKKLIDKWTTIMGPVQSNAEKKLIERVKKLKDNIGVTYSVVNIKPLKQRWGSCTSKGVLNFNWRIIIAPISIVDYVVAHELCHIIHHDHSNEFWKLMQKVMPDYLDRKEWLRVNGAMLDI